MLARGRLSLCSFPLRTPQRVFGLFGRDGVRPRRLESESAGSFLGGAFRGRFNYRAQRIAEETGIFPVGVVDAPELIAWTRSRGRAHGGSSPQADFAKMYQLHKMHTQSYRCPGSSCGESRLGDHQGRRSQARRDIGDTMTRLSISISLLVL